MELTPRTRQNAKEYRRLRAYGWLWALFAAALAVAFVFTGLFTAIQSADAGMAPTIEEYDIILFGKLAHHLRAPRRGDILAFQQQKGGPIQIGRAIALPGETVTVFEGCVYIDGVLLDERAYASDNCPAMEGLTIPEGYYFILPDARALADISDPAALLLCAKRIVGTARVRVSPFARIALFE